MTISTRLDQWKQRGLLSPEQHIALDGLARREPFSVFLELNLLLYAGILAFIAGLGWTVTTWSQQLGDLLILTALSVLLTGCFWYCFSRAPAWSVSETPSPNLAFDYVLYVGSLTWTVQLTYLEQHFRLLSNQRDVYLLLSAALFFFLAYRFDNRFVLSLALSSLAGWFGVTISRWPSDHDSAYRQAAILYSLAVAGIGAALQRRDIKAHFFSTYLNVAANFLFWALLSGVFEYDRFTIWLLCLLAACIASCAWGVKRRQFSFVAYAAVYGYIGFSSILLRNIHGDNAVLSYFVITGIFMIIALVLIARRFAREA